MTVSDSMTPQKWESSLRDSLNALGNSAEKGLLRATKLNYPVQLSKDKRSTSRTGYESFGSYMQEKGSRTVAMKMSQEYGAGLNTVEKKVSDVRK